MSGVIGRRVQEQRWMALSSAEMHRRLEYANGPFHTTKRLSVSIPYEIMERIEEESRLRDIPQSWVAAELMFAGLQSYERPEIESESEESK